ncbi:MAG: hypothetical protein WC551_10870 [Patescibacteria group bacterium]
MSTKIESFADLPAKWRPMPECEHHTPFDTPCEECENLCAHTLTRPTESGPKCLECGVILPG